jgi:NAD-dependent deacetylase
MPQASDLHAHDSISPFSDDSRRVTIMIADSNDFRAACDILRGARRVVVFTGAGVSAESGIPTFRDESGFWQRFPPEDFACWSGLLRTAVTHPTRFVDFLLAVIEPIAVAAPNPAHQAIAELEKYRQTTVITQNVDGLHQEAGSSRVREIHGTFLQSVSAGGQLVRSLTRSDLRHVVEQLHRVRDGKLTLLRLPGALNGMLRLFPTMERPRIVLFGEAMAEPDWTNAQHDVRECEVMLVVGTSGLVYPAAALPLWAKQAGASVIVVDPHPHEDADLWLPGKAGEVLPRLVSDISPGN